MWVSSILPPHQKTVHWPGFYGMRVRETSLFLGDLLIVGGRRRWVGRRFELTTERTESGASEFGFEIRTTALLGDAHG